MCILSSCILYTSTYEISLSSSRIYVLCSFSLSPSTIDNRQSVIGHGTIIEFYVMSITGKSNRSKLSVRCMSKRLVAYMLSISKKTRRFQGMEGTAYLIRHY